MGFYLVHPRKKQLKRKQIFNLELGCANVVLIISSDFSTKNKSKKSVFSSALNYFITEPQLIDDNQLEKYFYYVNVFAEENPNFTIGSDLIFLAVPENEYIGQIYESKNTLIILEKVSQTIKNKFENYEFTIVDDY